MSWEVIYLPEVENDYNKLSRRQTLITDKAIKRVKGNPLPENEGGYGKPLGHNRGRNFTGYMKIGLMGEGIRIAYKLIKTETKMSVIIIGLREDDELHNMAAI